MSSDEEEEEQRDELGRLLTDLGYPSLTPEEQVQADVLKGPFVFGTRVYVLFEQTYYPCVVMGHNFDYSEYDVKCAGDGAIHLKKYDIIIPMSSLKVGDKVEIFDEEEKPKRYVSFQLTAIPSKSNSEEWFDGKFKARKMGINEEMDLDWHDIHLDHKEKSIHKNRFKCDSAYPNESSTPCLRRPRNSSANSINQQSSSSARDSRASNRRSRNDTANSSTPSNETPAKRPRKKRGTVVKEESPSESIILLEDSGEDLSSQHPELFIGNHPETSNQIGQRSTHSNSNSVSAISGPTTSSSSSKVPAKNRGKRKANVSDDISINQLGQKIWQLRKAGNLEFCTLNFDGTEVEILKCLLVARSNVFTQLISSNGNVIRIEGCNPEAIDVFVEYLHCGKAEKLSDFAIDLLPLAKKYEIDGLEANCLKCLDTLITDENLFEKIKLIPQQNELKQLVLDFIKNKASKDAILDFLLSLEWNQFAISNNELHKEISKEIRKRL